MFKFNKSVARSSAHALGDPYEIKRAYDDLLKTGCDLDVAMSVTQSFQADMGKFANR